MLLDFGKSLVFKIAREVLGGRSLFSEVIWLILDLEMGLGSREIVSYCT